MKNKMKMEPVQKTKVMIITHPLGSNYGGIMQAYALQRFLKGMNLIPVTTTATKRTVPQYAKNILWNLVKKKTLIVDSPSVERTISKLTRIFIGKHIQTTRLKLTEDAHLGYGAFVVGSDQVWRKRYVKVSNYLLDFVPEDAGVKRLSYAASFGADNLEDYGEDLLSSTAKLASMFDAISVREDSGVDLVKRHWLMEAEQHIDPTFLLDKVTYEKVIVEDEADLTTSDGGLFAYVLDRGMEKLAIIDRVSEAAALKSFFILPGKTPTFFDWIRHRQDYVLPRVTQWLKSFRDSEFVVTDSFHGVVFSIIFHKPFIAIGNKERGLARFTSLLKLFGLEDRLITSVDDLSEDLINADIDWKRIDAVIKREQKRSTDYLKKHLG